MRHAPISSKLFVENRKRLTALMQRHSLAVVNANDILPTNADGTFLIHPNADLFYLTGIEQEESLLLLAPDAFDEKLREVLFLRETNDVLTMWEGHKHSREEASKISGIKNVKWLSELPVVLHMLMCEVEHVYLNSNEHRRAQVVVESRDARFAREFQAKYPLHHYQRLARLMNDLRVVKSDAEVELLRKACAVTRRGFLRVLRKLKPGMQEFEVEAEFVHEFTRCRCKFAYPPIIASGKNACVLHYQQNDQPCRKGDVLLMDVAANYANYNADLTRSVPVSGRFTKRQRQVYDAVLRVVRAMIKAARPGKLHRDWQKESEALMQEELLRLGLLTTKDIKKQDPDKPALKKYFMHGLGHPLGLDVHDLSFQNTPFAPGWVLTVEPGIYIPGEGLGIRLENDILVTSGEAVDLMADIPIEAEEIEDLMNA